MKKAKYWWSLLAGCLGALLVLRGWWTSQAARAQAESDQVQVVQAKIQAQGYEFGPAVNKIVLQLSQAGRRWILVPSQRSPPKAKHAK